jgi:hypothetical protein
MTRTTPATAEIHSTLLARVTYDLGDSCLQLEFCDGAIYAYFAVSETVHRELLAADSKGVYFNTQIRSRFRYTCLRRPE